MGTMKNSNFTNKISIHNTGDSLSNIGNSAYTNVSNLVESNAPPTREEVELMVQEDVLEIVHLQAKELKRLRESQDTKSLDDLQSLMNVAQMTTLNNEGRISTMESNINPYQSALMTIQNWEYYHAETFMNLMTVIDDLKQKVQELEIKVDILQASSNDEDVI